MGNQDLKSIAEELSELLSAPTRTDPVAPVVDESYLVAAEPTESPEATAAAEQEDLLPELIRSIVEYAVKKAPPSASAKNIGEAIGEGVFEAVNQLKLDDVKTVEAVDAFLSELCESVHNTLSVE
jgi:hypothetical protein